MRAAEITETDDGIFEISGNQYMRDAKGALLPIETVKPQHKLEDEIVRKIMGFAVPLSEQIARFKGHTFEDLGAFDLLLAQQYNSTRGGKKGNRTYQTIDGCKKVVVQVADLIDFGSELQTAKELIDDCLSDWTADGRAEIRAIVLRAFNVEKAGQINKAELFMLLSLKIEDARWQDAMQAITDAIRVTGSKTYVRLYVRDNVEAAWEAVTIDLAKA